MDAVPLPSRKSLDPKFPGARQARNTNTTQKDERPGHDKRRRMNETQGKCGPGRVARVNPHPRRCLSPVSRPPLRILRMALLGAVSVEFVTNIHRRAQRQPRATFCFWTSKEAKSCSHGLTDAERMVEGKGNAKGLRANCGLERIEQARETVFWHPPFISDGLCPQ